MSSGTSSVELTAAIASVIEVVFVAAAGLSALFLYRRYRRGQVRVGITATCRLVEEWNPGRALLLVKLRIANTSSVVYWHREATATLMDARKETETGGQIHLAPFSQADPFLPVYGEMHVDTSSILEGKLFSLSEDSVSLEPGEFVESELAFPLDQSRLGTMAMRVLIRGAQRRRFRPPDYWWGTFFYVDPRAAKIGSGIEGGDAQ